MTTLRKLWLRFVYATCPARLRWTHTDCDWTACETCGKCTSVADKTWLVAAIGAIVLAAICWALMCTGCWQNW